MWGGRLLGRADDFEGCAVYEDSGEEAGEEAGGDEGAREGVHGPERAVEKRTISGKTRPSRLGRRTGRGG